MYTKSKITSIAIILMLAALAFSMTACENPSDRLFGDLFGHEAEGANNPGSDLINITITLHLEGGNIAGNSASPQHVHFNSSSQIDLPVPEKDGFIFRAWYTGPNGQGDQFPQVSIPPNMTFYAFWIEEGQGHSQES